MYWKPFRGVSPLEVISHRVIWSLLLLGILVFAFREGAEVRSLLRNGKRLGVLFLTASLLSVNWGLFIYAVGIGQVVQSSLGYFLNPLVSIVLAFVFLRERLTGWQVAAVILAAAGAAHFGWHIGTVPWIAIGIALSFALYGLLRKIVAVSPLVGMLVETALMTPAALGLIAFFAARGQAGFGSELSLTLLFLGAGVVTTLPLLWFNKAAKLLRLSTLGFLQFLTPTLQLLVGVCVFHEPFSHRAAVSFALIWSGIGLYLLTLWKSPDNAVPVPTSD